MLIGLCGEIGSGKDAVANTLWLCYNFEKEKFARPLYNAISTIFSADPYLLMNDRELKESIIPGFDFTYRKALQTLGTEWRNTLDTNLWIKLLEQRMHRNGSKNFVISDLRFIHEAEWIKQQGGYIIHIVRVENPFTIETDHSSEQADLSSYWNDVISNSGTLEELAQDVNAMVADLGAEEVRRANKLQHQQQE